MSRRRAMEVERGRTQAMWGALVVVDGAVRTVLEWLEWCYYTAATRPEVADRVLIEVGAPRAIRIDVQETSRPLVRA